MKKSNKIIWLLFSLCVLILALCWIMWSVPITTVTVTGNVYHTADEIESILFEGKDNPSSLGYYLKELVNKKTECVFLQDYTMTWVDFQTVEIEVQEKEFLGYVEYMGSYLYFDDEGIIVYSTKTEVEGVPLVQGISFQQLIMYQKLNTMDDSVFTSLMELTRMLYKYDLHPQTIRFCVNDEINLYIDNITVQLGTIEYLEGKVQELAAMIDELMERIQGQTGVLHLEDYDGENPQKLYYFKLTK